jgi:hypothetical protein
MNGDTPFYHRGFGLLALMMTVLTARGGGASNSSSGSVAGAFSGAGSSSSPMAPISETNREF